MSRGDRRARLAPRPTGDHRALDEIAATATAVGVESPAVIVVGDVVALSPHALTP